LTNDTPRATALVADDDEALLRVLSRVVKDEGYTVLAVADGDEAVKAFAAQPFDLVISDIDMPGQSGIELLQAIRARDLDVPVVLVTGGPKLETAMSAVEYGASHYLTKPVDIPRLQTTIRRATQAGRLARARRQLAQVAEAERLEVSDLAGLNAHFDSALATAFMVYQPIVRWSNRSTFAYEALVRTVEPAIPHPGALFDAADRLNRVVEVGRRLRPMSASHVDGRTDFQLFVNLHTRDLMDESLYDPETPLAKIAPRVVLEVTERARLEIVSDVSARIARLRAMGFRIALDDIGAGYAGLTSFATLEPNFVKLDRGLVEGIAQSKHKVRLVGGMIRVCADLGVEVIGEGVETPAERDALIDLGCDLLQGYLFARPEKPFTTASF
jgi:EAL domain-containing protein (putative c-di-GMP-specific phosphodiesterase class I)